MNEELEEAGLREELEMRSLPELAIQGREPVCLQTRAGESAVYREAQNARHRSVHRNQPIVINDKTSVQPGTRRRLRSVRLVEFDFRKLLSLCLSGFWLG